MKKLLTIVVALVMVCSAVFALAACGENLSGTAAVVAEASKMSLADLEAASKAEMEASNDTFKVVGLTSVLDKMLKAFAEEYDWIKYGENTYVNNSYKDYQLLSALDTAEKSYFADFALVQDVRSMASIDGELVHNYVPSDWQTLGLGEEDLHPLKGVYFNKLFWTNSNFTNVTGQTLHNIWQLAGQLELDKDGKPVVENGKFKKSPAHDDYINNISFQSAATEQINMSFLLSAEAPENQARIEAAYKKFYNKDWSSETYASAGQQWVTEFIANITRFHSSDGTAMKETQLKSDWEAGYVYYGAFAKMKDAVGKSYDIPAGATIGVDILEGLKGSDGKVNAMDTVKWDWQIDGFNGFMYAMCSQIVNNAKHPYTACLYAHFLATRTAYEGAIYNNALPAEDGSKGTIKVNQYGYYFPASNTVTYAKGDWTRDKHIELELVEDFNFLGSVKITQVNRILGLISQNAH